MNEDAIEEKKEDKSFYFLDKIFGKKARDFLYNNKENLLKKNLSGSIFGSLILFKLLDMYEGDNEYSYAEDQKKSSERFRRIRSFINDGKDKKRIYEQDYGVVFDGFVNDVDGRNTEKKIDNLINEYKIKSLILSEINGIEGDDDFNRKLLSSHDKEKFIKDNIKKFFDNIEKVKFLKKENFVSIMRELELKIDDIIGDNLDNVKWKKDKSKDVEILKWLSVNYATVKDHMPNILSRSQKIREELDEEITESKNEYLEAVEIISSEFLKIEEEYAKKILVLKNEFLSQNNVEKNDLDYIDMKMEYIKNSLENGFFEDVKKKMKELMKEFTIERERILSDIFFNIDLYRDVVLNKDKIFYLYKKDFKIYKKEILSLKKDIKMMEDIGACLECIMNEYESLFDNIKNSLKKKEKKSEYRKEYLDKVREIKKWRKIEKAKLKAAEEIGLAEMVSKINILEKRKRSIKTSLARGDEILHKDQAGIIPTE